MSTGNTPPELNTIDIEIDGDVATMTLNRPESFNAMSPEMIAELPVAFAWFADISDVRAIIITGGKIVADETPETLPRSGREPRPSTSASSSSSASACP